MTGWKVTRVTSGPEWDWIEDDQTFPPEISDGVAWWIEGPDNVTGYGDGDGNVYLSRAWADVHDPATIAAARKALRKATGS